MKRFLIAVLLLLVFIPIAISATEFWGSRTSNKYHYPTCKWTKQISPSNLVKFKSPEEALDPALALAALHSLDLEPVADVPGHGTPGEDRHLLEHHPTVAFSIQEACLASRVTIVGGASRLPEDTLDLLKAAGCQLEQMNQDGTLLAI